MQSVDEIRVGTYRLALRGAYGATLERDPTPVSRPFRAAEPDRLSPPQAPEYAGRQRERAELASLLHAHRMVYVVASAAGEVTTFLRHIASAQLSSDLPDTALYLDEPDDSIWDVLTRVFQLRFRTSGAFKPLEHDLREALANLRALIVLDGTALSPQKLTTFASFVPGSRIVAAKTNVQAEDNVPCVSLLPLDDQDAMALLAMTLGRPVRAAERAAALALCKALGGVPATIRYVGAIARDQAEPLETYARMLGAAGGLERIANASFSTYSDRESAIVALLAIAGCAIDGAFIACMTGMNGCEAILTSLRHRQVVLVDGTMHRLTPGIAPLLPATWSASPDLDRIASALLEQLASTQRLMLSGQEAALARRVVDVSMASSRWDTARRVGTGVSDALASAGRWDAWASVLAQIQLAAQRANDESTTAWTFHQLGARSVALGESDAHELIERALALRVRLADSFGVTATRWLLAFAPPRRSIEKNPINEFATSGRGAVTKRHESSPASRTDLPAPAIPSSHTLPVPSVGLKEYGRSGLMLALGAIAGLGWGIAFGAIGHGSRETRSASVAPAMIRTKDWTGELVARDNAIATMTAKYRVAEADRDRFAQRWRSRQRAAMPFVRATNPPRTVSIDPAALAAARNRLAVAESVAVRLRKRVQELKTDQASLEQNYDAVLGALHRSQSEVFAYRAHFYAQLPRRR